MNFTALALPGIQTLHPYIPGKPIATLKRELGITGEIIKLASNENPLGASPKAVAAVKAAVDTHRYPEGGYALKQKIAALHGVEMNQIVLGNGSNDILELVARVFLHPAVNAVFSDYAFAVYPIVTQAVGADIRLAPSRPLTDAQPYGYDLATLAQTINAQTRVVYVANPNNPTGTWLAPDALEAFIQQQRQDVLIVLDEAYTE